MGTLVVAMLIVAASAAGFGVALFGRRPAPQPATEAATAHLAATPVEVERQQPESTSSADPGDPGDSVGRFGRRVGDARRRRRALPESDPTISRWTRVRAALLLALTVAGLAALVGAALSILVVGLVLLVT